MFPLQGHLLYAAKETLDKMATDNIATLVIGDSKADTELKQLIDFFRLSDKGITVQLHKDSKKLQFQKVQSYLK